MTFEEKLAAQGRKLDEMKARLDATVNARNQLRQETREEMAAELKKLDAAFDEFDAAVEAKIDAQLDAADAKLDATAEKISASLDEAEAKADMKAEQVKAAFTLDKATAETIANEPTRIDEIQKGTEAQVARAKGDVAAAEENARLVHEQRDSKRDAAKLCAQMKVDNAKEKISERREAIDKAAEEAWILDLLDYAVSCYDMANAWALEAEYTLMEAAYEIDYYNEHFCKETE